MTSEKDGRRKGHYLISPRASGPFGSYCHHTTDHGYVLEVASDFGADIADLTLNLG